MVVSSDRTAAAILAESILYRTAAPTKFESSRRLSRAKLNLVLAAEASIDPIHDAALIVVFLAALANILAEIACQPRGKTHASTLQTLGPFYSGLHVFPREGSSSRYRRRPAAGSLSSVWPCPEATPAVSIANRSTQLEKEIQIVCFFDVPDAIEPCVMYAWVGGNERASRMPREIVHRGLSLDNPCLSGGSTGHKRRE